MNIRESQIEDVLASHTDIARLTLNLSGDLTLIARQKILISGDRIDLLFVCDNQVLLVELKIERFQRKFLEQTQRYAEQLRALQTCGALVAGEINPFLVCTKVSEADKAKAHRAGVNVIEYDPEQVLREFYTRFQSRAPYHKLKPTNHGLWNLHLLNRLLYNMEEPKKAESLAAKSSLSKSSVRSYLSLARELKLVAFLDETWFLTENGTQYVWGRDKSGGFDFVSEDQCEMLRDIIIQNPFHSGAILGIYTIVESIYNLSKSTYPVDKKDLIQYFKQSCGRQFEWNSLKTASDATRMYSNYAIDLGLAAKMGEKFYLTPVGVRFIMLLNLHKTIKMVDSLGFSGRNKYLS
ncbi:MAG: hypothetical protein KDB65_01315 [Calditrichaeota bacterium]|nr:hypothetical protein [Calditrichota bacterium]MCB9369140.1 hypothetical protein [Calditrichota bacterium]